MSATHTVALRIATRKSRLALAQTQSVAAMLARVSGCAHTLVEITTKGDAVLGSSIASIGGDGVFVKELEAALLDDRADIAVHSLKDMPTEIPAGVDAGVIVERGDARDALISRDNRFPTIASLPPNAVVGTSSLRRRAQLLDVRPDLDVRDLRGNVDTRVKKVLDGDYDAAVLALAGLQRIGLLGALGGGAPLDPASFIPAAGQGAIFVQCRAGDDRVARLVAPLQHEPTAAATALERSFLRYMGGGCLVPIGAHATIGAGRVTLHAFVGAPDGRFAQRRSFTCDVRDAHARAGALAAEMLDAGGREVIARFRNAES